MYFFHLQIILKNLTSSTLTILSTNRTYYRYPFLMPTAQNLFYQ